MNKTVFREVHLVMLGREDMYWDLDLGFSFQKAHIYIFLKYAICSCPILFLRSSFLP